MKKLAIITSHPIQYNAPLFKTLAERENIEIRVFYTWSQAEEGFFDKEFNKKIKWNIPLLEAYNYEFVTNVSRKPGSKRYRGIICPELISKIEIRKPDALLFYGWAFHAHYKAMRYFKGNIPVLFKGDSTLLDEKPGIKKLFRNKALKYIYNSVDYAFFVGTHNKNYFIKAGLKKEQLKFLPYTVDYNHFTDNNNNRYKEKAKKIREQIGIKQKDKVVAFIGKFIKKKNPVFVLKAIKKYNSQNETNVKLLFIGSGKKEIILKKLAQNDPNVFFLPFVNQKEMPVAYRISDIFVLPSIGPHETWGISVNEALACNRFVLLSDKVGCAIDIVKGSNNGKIYKSENFDSFAENLRLLLKKDRFEPIIKEKSFGLEQAAQTIEEIVNRL